MVYDGFGGVLTSTVPLALSNALPGMLDVVTGLVHLGGGRWYDPALGRPLQPNPAGGGPPTVPHRYAATPLGQPGVYQAASSTSSFGLWAQQQAIKVPAGLAAGKYLFEPRLGEAFSWATKETGWLRVSIQAEKRLIPGSLQHLDLISRQTPGLGRRVRGLFQDGWRTALSDAYHVETRIGRIHSAGLNTTLADAAHLNLRVLERETAEVFTWGSKAILGDLGAGIFLDVAFQVGGDWDNPYLTPRQKFRRAAVSGGGAVLSTGAGLSVARAIAFWGGPPAWVAVGAGLVVELGTDYLFNKYATPLIYDYIGANPQRALEPYP